jgi:hypothetical protein
MVNCSKTCSPTTTVGEERTVPVDDHVHALLVVGDCKHNGVTPIEETDTCD